jgi:hypothetical protein
VGRLGDGILVGEDAMNMFKLRFRVVLGHRIVIEDRQALLSLIRISE